MMPNGVALGDVEDDCTALYHALVDLSPIIVLTWLLMRQPSLGMEGGQPPAQEQPLYLNHLGQIPCAVSVMSDSGSLEAACISGVG